MAVMGIIDLPVITDPGGLEQNRVLSNLTGCVVYEAESSFDRTEVLVIFVIMLYTLVFCGCFFGNMLVIIVLVTSRKLRSTTNVFLANLAIADFSVGVFCVYQNLYIYLAKSWLLGDFVCKMYHFIHNLSYTASIFILVVLSVERYLAILRPITCKTILTPLRIQISVAAVWATSCALCATRFHWARVVTRDPPNGRTEPAIFCVSNRPTHNQELWDGLSFLLFYLVPLAIVSTLYSRIGVALWMSTKLGVGQPGTSLSVVSGRRRAVRLLAAIVTTFAVCHLPLHGRRLWLHWSEHRKDPSHTSAVFTAFTHIAAYANSAMNPLLYALLSRNFRVSISHLVQKCKCAEVMVGRSGTRPVLDVHPRRCRRRRCSPGEGSDSSPQTTMTFRGDSVRGLGATCPMIAKEDVVSPKSMVLTDGSERELIRSP